MAAEVAIARISGYSTLGRVIKSAAYIAKNHLFKPKY
jgi:hypothetical protein